MHGLMMKQPLLISSLLEYAARFHGTTEIVSRTLDGQIHRYTYADAQTRAKQLAKALERLGVGPGDRVATMAWNSYRHYELYYGVSGMGAICHMINPRLFTGQIAYIINHARDSLIFTDLTFLPLLEQISDALNEVRGIVVMTDEDNMPDSALPGLHCYENPSGGRG